jgi:hypothetical protein
MRLEDDVGLPGDEVPRAVGVREERRGRRLQGRGWRFGLNAIRSRCIRQHRIDRLRRSTGHSLRRRLERRDAEEQQNHQHRHRQTGQPSHAREEENHPPLILTVLCECGANVHVDAVLDSVLRRPLGGLHFFLNIVYPTRV